MSAFDRILSFAARNERKLGAGLFAFGFATDFLTFGLLPISVVVWVFVGYLLLAAVSIFGAHATAVWHETEVRWKKGVAVLFPLIAQYAFGGLLSGFVVFYAKNSVLGVSWPFIVILALLYAGNEYFRMYKHYLVFQTTIFFFALYAFSVFALPLLTGTVGPLTFLGSTAASVALFAVFVWLLILVNHTRFTMSARSIITSCAVILVVVSGSYFGGLIPPIPLALKDAGIYHSLTRVEGNYRVTAEAPEPWWRLGTDVIEHVPGETLYAYSAVAAPGNLSGSVAHRWQWFDPTQGKWITKSDVSFPMIGGREGGYRGYSYMRSLAPGKWRVSVETPSGLTIGRLRFEIKSADSLPALTEKVL